MFYNLRSVTYKDGSVDSRVYERGMEKSVEKKERKCELKESENNDEKKKKNRECSRKRTIRAVYEIVKNQEWDYFVTMTFNPEKVDRYDYSLCSTKLSQWLNNIRKKNKDMKYIFVPERHKDGAFHFHGLLSDVDDLSLTYSGHDDIKGRPIFNIGCYKLGFTTCTRVSNSDAAIKYVLKYLTKELDDYLFGKKRYWVSKNIDRPVVEYVYLDPVDKNFLIQEYMDTCTYAKEVTNNFNDVLYFTTGYMSDLSVLTGENKYLAYDYSVYD